MTLIALMMLAADPLAEPLPEIVLLDFTASYCGPCQEMVPAIQQMQEDGFPVRKVDISVHPDISRQYHVEKIPTFILLVNGQEKKRLIGRRSANELRRLMLAERDALRAQQQPAEPPEEESAPPEVVEEPSRPGGLSGIFAMIRDGLGGRRQARGFQHPTFRAQSPEALPSDVASDVAMSATVRVRVKKQDKTEDVGTGSVIHSVNEAATILTCAHLFRGAGDKPVVDVEVFQGDRVLKYPAEVIVGSHDLELAILQIRTVEALPAVQVAPMAVDVRRGEAAFSIGCNHGQPPSHLAVKVVDIDRYKGPSNLVCTIDPAVGRSGGGLFNSEGQLIGVCSCADRDQQEGLYMGRRPIHDLFAKVDLEHLLKPRSSQEKSPVFNERTTDLARGTEIASFIEQGIDDAEEPDDFSFAESLAEDDLPEFSQGLAGDEVTMAALQETVSSESVPEEITVIVGSGDRPKEMIVIRKPSPWLMQLLTGRTPAEPQLASVRKTDLAPSDLQADLNTAGMSMSDRPQQVKRGDAARRRTASALQKTSYVSRHTD